METTLGRTAALSSKFASHAPEPPAVNTLPLLPGLTFPHMKQRPTFAKYTTLKIDSKSGKREVGDFPVIPDEFSPAAVTVDAAATPAASVLRYVVTFRDSSPGEAGADVRRGILAFFPEDGSVSVTETRVRNSGRVGGPLVARHAVPGVTPSTLLAGAIVRLNGFEFTITACDAATAARLSAVGITPPPLPPPPTPQPPRVAPSEAALARRAAARQAVELDGHVLRFGGVWDDDAPHGGRRRLAIYFYLADNTVRIVETAREDGRDPTPAFLKRAPLPSVPSPDALRIGSTIDVHGRRVLIADCDTATARWLEARGQPTAPLPLADPPIPYGSTAPRSAPAALASLAPLRDVGDSAYIGADDAARTRLVRLRGRGHEDGEVVRALGHVADPHPSREGLTFLARFTPDALGGVVSVYEQPQRNSGTVGGVVVDKARVTNPDTGAPFTPADFLPGSRTVIRGVEYVWDSVAPPAPPPEDATPAAVAAAVRALRTSLAGRFASGTAALRAFGAASGAAVVDPAAVAAYAAESLALRLSPAAVEAVAAAVDADGDGVISRADFLATFFPSPVPPVVAPAGASGGAVPMEWRLFVGKLAGRWPRACGRGAFRAMGGTEGPSGMLTAESFRRGLREVLMLSLSDAQYDAIVRRVFGDAPALPLADFAAVIERASADPLTRRAL